MTACADCKWWAGLDYPAESPNPKEAPTPEGTTWGMCRYVTDRAHTIMETRDEPHSLRAYAADASNYSAHLMVRSDFGCVEFDARGDG